MRVLLVFRNKVRGGKSIEVLFSRLRNSADPDIGISSWEMPAASVITRILSLRRSAADVYHVTGDINYAALFLWGRNVILTLHDIGRYKELKGLRRYVYGLLWIKWPCLAARKVVTVSRYTANDIVSHFPSIPSSKIEVISNGYDPDYRPVPRIFNISRPALLQVGTAAHKNLRTVISVASQMPCKLMIVGALTTEELSRLNSSNIEYEHFLDVDQDALQKIYERADILLFLSTHEGFGLPILEAQAVGRPVITTRAASIPEVAGDGALYIADPFNPMEVISCIERLVNDEKYRQLIIEKGRNNIKRYTMEEMTMKYLAAYRECLKA